MKNHIIETLLRYALGLIMVAYGLIKILGIQFVLPEAVYNLPLRELDGVTLTWAFLGFSPFFSITIGLLELIPGLMLLFTRTKLIGAILLLPSLIAVVLINNAFGFLIHMRIFSLCLLITDGIILSFHYKKIQHSLSSLLGNKSKRQSIEVILNLILAGIIFGCIFYFFT